MRKVENRMAAPVAAQPVVETRTAKPEPQPEPEPKRARGVVCKWCGKAGQSIVRCTWPPDPEGRILRRHFCRACKREFQTRQAAI